MVTVEKGYLQTGGNNITNERGEKPPGGKVVLTDPTEGKYKELLSRLEPDEQIYVQRLRDARFALQGGNNSAWKQFKDGNKTSKDMGGRLRGKVEGRQLLELIYKSIPIADSITPEVKESARVVHGEVNIGEIDNLEGIVIKN